MPDLIPVFDDDAVDYLDGVVEVMVRRFAHTHDSAIEKLNVLFEHIRVKEEHLLLYHETPLYWAQAAHYGRRDFWRDTTRGL